MVTVRTTMRPDEELEVSEREAGDLANMGLLVRDEPKPKPRAQDSARDEPK